MTGSDDDNSPIRLGYGRSHHRRRKWFWKILLGVIGLPVGVVVTFGLAWLFLPSFDTSTGLWAAGFTAFVLVPLGAVLGCVLGVMIGARFDRGHRRAKPGHCPCGYDLRGNESGTCSECGVQVPK